MEYKYELIRSPRKSMSITISNDNKITVRCPWTVSRAAIDKFLDSKEAWIHRVVARNAERLARNDDVIEYRSVYFCGERMKLVIGDRTGVSDGCVYVTKIEDIEKLFTGLCSEEFFKEVDEIAAVARLTPRSVSIKGYKGRWGCCDAKNNLIFNYILFMLPKRIQRYVIVHELCHTLCHDHSPAFWKLVSDYEPRYKALKKELAEYDFLTSLY